MGLTVFNQFPQRTRLLARIAGVAARFMLRQVAAIRARLGFAALVIGGGSSGLFLCVSAPSVRPKSRGCKGGERGG